jgi:NAD-dependent deacetylase
VGSTLSVWPAAGIPLETIRQGGRLVIVNDGATDLDGMASLLLSGRAGTVLPELAGALLGDRESR